MRPPHSFVFALFAVTLLWVLPLGASAAELTSDASLEVELVASAQLRAPGRAALQSGCASPALPAAVPVLVRTPVADPLPLVRVVRRLPCSPLAGIPSLGRAPPGTSD